MVRFFGNTQSQHERDLICQIRRHGSQRRALSAGIRRPRQQIAPKGRIERSAPAACAWRVCLQTHGFLARAESDKRGHRASWGNAMEPSLAPARVLLFAISFARRSHSSQHHSARRGSYLHSTCLHPTCLHPTSAVRCSCWLHVFSISSASRALRAGLSSRCSRLQLALVCRGRHNGWG